MIETAVGTELEPTPEPKSRGWVKAILVVVCALIAAMWVYAFLFAPKAGVYFVTEKAWRASADQICASAQQQRLALADTAQGYIANPTHEQMIQRAEIVDRATDLLDGMVTDIEALPLAGSDDQPNKNRERVDIFVKYYRQIIADRRAYTARLRAFDLAPYRETLVNGGPVTNVVIDFTTGNDIDHCLPPGELGGDA
jgi:hypothetical protein